MTLSQYASSPGSTYAELARSSLAVAISIATYAFPWRMARLSWPGWFG